MSSLLFPQVLVEVHRKLLDRSKKFVVYSGGKCPCCPRVNNKLNSDTDSPRLHMVQSVNAPKYKLSDRETSFGKAVSHKCRLEIWSLLYVWPKPDHFQY